MWVARNPPGFAFIEFEIPRDAADAVRELDGWTMCGCRVRVELSNGEKQSQNRGPPPSWNRRPRDDYRKLFAKCRWYLHSHCWVNVLFSLLHCRERWRDYDSVRHFPHSLPC